MRTKQEINKIAKEIFKSAPDSAEVLINRLIVEVLLDIRELLAVDKSKE